LPGDVRVRQKSDTVCEQAKHAEERERVLRAIGERRGAGNPSFNNPATVAGLDKTFQG
jgi:hypothetical protein